MLCCDVHNVITLCGLTILVSMSILSFMKPLNLLCSTKITCLDVTPGGLAASCDTDGHLLVWTTDKGEVRVHNLILFTS